MGSFRVSGLLEFGAWTASYRARKIRLLQVHSFLKLPSTDIEIRLGLGGAESLELGARGPQVCRL